ncbi:MAG: MoxR family ATPase [Proteobacteria bacterium]|nr:MoxR family ATPase [Pseudomonadota bacterium]
MINLDQPLEASLPAAVQTCEKIINNVGKFVIGQQHLRRRLLTSLMTEGHILLEGVPGLAKTLAIKVLANSIGASFQRIQFTPDLLPSDVIGTEVFRPQDAKFEIRKGPIFANLVLADEINRAPAKVQSALLETMQEKQVTIGNQTLKIPDPFFVMATQNPIEQEGTYPLPEAQIDRFMVKVKVDYPSYEQEKQMLDLIVNKNSFEDVKVEQVATIEDIIQLKKLTEKIYVDEKVKKYIVNIVHATRSPEKYGLKINQLIELGASPRATIALLSVARAEALINGELYVGPQIIKSIGYDVLRHRIIPSYEAEAQGLKADDLVKMILDSVEVP